MKQFTVSNTGARNERTTAGTELDVCSPAGPGAYTPQEPQSPHKKHRDPDVCKPAATTAIAALQAKLRSSRRAAGIEASAVEEIVKATLKHGSVQVCNSASICEHPLRGQWTKSQLFHYIISDAFR